MDPKSVLGGFPPQSVVFSPTVQVVSGPPARHAASLASVRLPIAQQHLNKSWDEISVHSDGSSRSSNASSAYHDPRYSRMAYRPGSPCSDVASEVSSVSCRSELADDCFSLASGHSGRSEASYPPSRAINLGPGGDTSVAFSINHGLLRLFGPSSSPSGFFTKHLQLIVAAIGGRNRWDSIL